MLSIRDRLLYGAGQMTESIKNTSLAVFLLFYYNNVLGLNPVLAGLSMLLALIVDSLIDPLVGAVSDRWRSHLGRRHPFMYAAIAPFLLGFYFLFAPPAELLPAADASLDRHLPLFAWLTVFGLGSRIALSIYCVPHFALGAELSDDYQARTQIAAAREGLGAIGSLTVYALAFAVYFDGPLGQREADAYPGFALAMTIVMCAAMLLSSLGTQHLIGRLPKQSAVVERAPVWSLALELFRAFRNRNFTWYFSGAVMLYMLVGVDLALALYVNTYIWGLSGQPLMWISMGAFVGYLVGAAFTRKLYARWEKKQILIASTAWFSVLQMLPILLWFAGWMPATGSATLVITLTAVRIVQGVGTIQFRTAGNSMLADVADEYELQCGARQEGVLFGAQMITYKATSGLGKFVAGVFLALIAWPTTEQIATSGVDHSQLVWLGLLYGPFVAGFAVFSLLCYSRYRLDARAHRRIREQLDARSGGRTTQRDKRSDAAQPLPPALAPTPLVAPVPIVSAKPTPRRAR